MPSRLIVRPPGITMSPGFMPAVQAPIQVASCVNSVCFGKAGLPPSLSLTMTI